MRVNFDKKDRIFAGIIILVHMVFFLLALHYTRIYMGDSFEYIYEALNIKRYFFFYSGNPAMPILPEYMTQRQPGYPLFLLGVYLFVVNNWVVIVLQNALSLFNILYARRCLITMGFRKKYDWLLLLFIIAYPAQFINANTIAPDILLQTCTLFYFGSFILLIQRGELRYAIHMSVALIAGMLVKPVLYPFVVMHIIIILAVAMYQKTKMQRPVLIAIIPLCAVLFYNYWNYTRTDKFHFTSNQAFNALYYYYPFISRQEGADSANRFLQHARRAYDEIPDYKDRYDYANKVGSNLLTENFLPYMAFHLKNSARIFVEPGKAEMDLFTGKLTYGRLYNKEQTGFYATLGKRGWGGMREYAGNNPSLLIALLVFIFNIARLVGLVCFLLSRKVHGTIRLFTLVLLAYFAVAAGPISNTRYFLPVSLIAIGGAAMGYMNKFEKRTIVE